MNIYTFLSFEYDLLDIIWFKERGVNPRDVIRDAIKDENCKLLDMCCGTLSNGLSVAKVKPYCRVYGIDRSKDMLREAKRKVNKRGLTNIKLKSCDATQTGLKDKSFNYIVIGLVLHECSVELREGILKEAHRLLRDDGKLIVLEWEKQSSIFRRIKYAPLYALEVLNCKDFKDFFNCDKKEYFEENNFVTDKEIHCNYSSVLLLSKAPGEYPQKTDC